MQITFNGWTLLAGLALGAALASGVQPARAAATRYEYKSEQVLIIESPDAAITKAAGAGWEPYAVVFTPAVGHAMNMNHTIFFRRPR